MSKSTTFVTTAPAALEAAFTKSSLGKPLVVFSGFPQENEAITPDRIRDLAESLYQIARFAELDSYPAISLRY